MRVMQHSGLHKGLHRGIFGLSCVHSCVHCATFSYILHVYIAMYIVYIVQHFTLIYILRIAFLNFNMIFQEKRILHLKSRAIPHVERGLLIWFEIQSDANSFLSTSRQVTVILLFNNSKVTVTFITLIIYRNGGLLFYRTIFIISLR